MPKPAGILSHNPATLIDAPDGICLGASVRFIQDPYIKGRVYSTIYHYDGTVAHHVTWMHNGAMHKAWVNPIEIETCDPSPAGQPPVLPPERID